MKNLLSIVVCLFFGCQTVNDNNCPSGCVPSILFYPESDTVAVGGTYRARVELSDSSFFRFIADGRVHRIVPVVSLDSIAIEPTDAGKAEVIIAIPDNGSTIGFVQRKYLCSYTFPNKKGGDVTVSQVQYWVAGKQTNWGSR
jgi:hypothetical protein